ncbi:ethanolamine ammonia-lyase subunit EutC [Methylobacterium haplocladii]|uniref:Ethanolamine ammonia-lyase small subunit n=1 Tax=Methylobacterium haplocladii TaxID=1176176 RepID=A0A512IM05_9HYPH|nr:ethanolamine ammonia-lyase subunit EutC [Methylobacterium haplocladii]GEO98753.1 ethanolamine ammonia-lyase light chain [Methylobacterium haplocladii]GJD85070.1 Ethanolamine ammonia-lyase light chain [Methylobacterium haplocladii]GLS59254.1 ethanolamine ammonia-lyase light chain [Methylobacterium haplocladii]
MSEDDLWKRLARLTPARIGLGRAGSGLPTREVLGFGLAHARARDAVHTPMDVEAITEAVEALGLFVTAVASRAEDRATYLRRPDYGRRLAPASRDSLVEAAGESVDLALVVADGLSARAVHEGAARMLAALQPLADKAGWSLGPVVVASQARVALGDEIGMLLKAKAVAVLIGERPGLSSPDSLGLYLTFEPKPGRSDAERNCISNVRPAGLSHDLAAFKLHWLIAQTFSRGLSGVALKDESDAALEGPAERDALPGSSA